MHIYVSPGRAPTESMHIYVSPGRAPAESMHIYMSPGRAPAESVPIPEPRVSLASRVHISREPADVLPKGHVLEPAFFVASGQGFAKTL